MQKNSEEDKAYLKSVNGFTILLLVRQGRLDIRAYKNDNMTICFTANYDHQHLPIPFPSVFANVTELYNEFKSLKENMLQLTEAGHLQYTLPLATKTVELMLPLQKHINTRQEALQFDNFVLKKKVKELQVSKLKIENLLKVEQAKRKQLQQKVQLMTLRLKVTDKKRVQIQQSPFSAEKESNISVQKQTFEQKSIKDHSISNSTNNIIQQWMKKYEKPIHTEKDYKPQIDSGKRPATKLKWGNTGRRLINPTQRGNLLEIKTKELFNFFVDKQISKQNRFQQQSNQICLVQGEKQVYFDAISSDNLPMESRSVVGLRLIYEGDMPIFFGVLTQTAKTQGSMGESGKIALNLRGGVGCLRMEGVSIEPESIESFVRGQTIHFKICTTNGTMEWYRNKSLIFSHFINQSMLEEPLYAYLSMASTGSKIELL